MLLLFQNDDPAAASGEVFDAASNMWDSLLRALPRLGAAAVIAIIGWVISRLVRVILRRVFSRPKYTESFAKVMSKLGGWTVFVVGVLLAVTAAFPSVQPVDLLAGLGIFSVAIGFAFQDILENTLSGVLLLFRQPFESGDQIEVQEQTGTVEAITIRETRITTFDGELVVIPNRDVYKSVIRVQTHYTQRRLDFTVGIAFENDPALATAVIAEALLAVEGISSAPAPEALVTELGLSTVDVEVRFWTGPREHDARVVLDRATKAVKRCLDDEGIEMPAEIVVLQATPSFQAALGGGEDVTPGGALAKDQRAKLTAGATRRLGGSGHVRP